MIIDTHTHTYLNKKFQEDEIFAKLEDDEIDKIMSIGIDLETSQKAIDLSKKYAGVVFPVIGIHPTDTIKYGESFEITIKKLEQILIENIGIVKGIGECGYDFYRVKDLKENRIIQEKFFKAQIELAKKYSLPIIIHTRNAKEETLETLKEMGAKKFVLHCFSEDLDFAYKALYYSEECKISFSGIVTYKTATNVQKTAANIPLNRILVETDCPFLAPQAVRGTENIPNNTKYVLEQVFHLRQENGKKESFLELEKQIYKNSCEFFDI